MLSFYKESNLNTYLTQYLMHKGKMYIMLNMYLGKIVTEF